MLANAKNLSAASPLTTLAVSAAFKVIEELGYPAIIRGILHGGDALLELAGVSERHQELILARVRASLGDAFGVDLGDDALLVAMPAEEAEAPKKKSDKK